jgi:hypothetical protein
MKKTAIMAMAGAQLYSVHVPERHSDPSSSNAGASRWMNAVAMMTPEPKYFAKLMRQQRCF